MQQVIEPKVRGFICTTAHPEGCKKNVQNQIDYASVHSSSEHGPKKVLIIGASTGYGLASRITAAFGYQAQTIGVFFERQASGKRTASAGWYNTVAFEHAAHEKGLYAKSINGDAFSNDIKQQTIDLIQRDWQGNVDLIIYSLASPRRTDPQTGEIYNSALKTIGAPFTNKNIDVFTGETSEITIEPANDDEITQTIAVMGGADWLLWLEQLHAANVLAKQVKTIAYDYIGPEITYPIYHEGTIGQAKADVRLTANKINTLLNSLDGHAYVSVNKAVVTQASSAIPIVPLYMSLLFKVMKTNGNHEGCIEQIVRLFVERLYSTHGVVTESDGLIHIDDWEMQDDVQVAVKELWRDVNTDNIHRISDLQGYRDEFYRLFGFKFDGVDYEAAIETDQNIPSIKIS